MEYRLWPYGRLGDDSVCSPSVAQYRFHSARQRFKMFLGGVGSGKTHAYAREFVNGVLANPDDLLYWSGSPSHAIIKDGTWPHFKRYLDDLERTNGRKIVKRYYMSDPREIVFINESRIRFIPLDKPDNYAAATLAGFGIDEAALVPDGMKAWNMLMQRLRDTRARKRFGLAATSPRGANGVVLHFEDRVAADDPDYFRVVSKTEENTANPPDYIELMKAGMSDREIRQQLEAEIMTAQGAVYGHDFHTSESMLHSWKPFKPGEKREGCDYYLLLDWGPKYPHVLWVEYWRERDIDVVFDELCDDDVHHGELLERAMVQSRTNWGITEADFTGIYCDDNPLDARLEAYRRFKRGRQKWEKPVISERQREGDWEYGIETVAWRLKSATGRRLLFAPRLNETRSRRRVLVCMTNYRWLDKPLAGSRVLTDNIEKGLYDHAPDALRYYCGPKYRAARWKRDAA